MDQEEERQLLQRMQQPWVGERDYSSGSDSDTEEDGGEDSVPEQVGDPRIFGF